MSIQQRAGYPEEYLPSDSSSIAANSDRPSYLPRGISDESIPDILRRETQYWSTGNGQELTEESAHALMDAVRITTTFYESDGLNKMGLDPQVPMHETLIGHSIRVSIFSLLTNQILKKYGSPVKVASERNLAIAGLIHDIGKLDPQVNEVVMSNSKWKTNASREWEIIKTHPEIGAWVALKMTGLSREVRNHVAQAVYQHHENYDGSGYYGKEAKDICPEARILRVADTVDAMSEPRTYRTESISSRKVMCELEKEKTKFDPDILRAIDSIRRKSGLFVKICKSIRP